MDHAKNEHCQILQSSELIKEERGDNIEGYRPLLILAGVALASGAVLSGSIPKMGFMASLMGFFLVLVSTLKLLDLHSFVEGFAEYDLIARKFPFWGYFYAPVELSIGVSFFNPSWITFTALGTILIQFPSLVGVIGKLKRKSHIQCYCVGGLIKLPLSWVTVFEYTVMLAMCAYILLQRFV